VTGFDATWAYFWLAVNKRPTRFWPAYFLTQPNAIFYQKGKIEKFGIFMGNFPNPEVADPSNQKMTQPRVKNFWRGPITNLDCPWLSIQCRHGPWSDLIPSIPHSKSEADLALAWVFFGPTYRDFFDPTR